MPRIPVGAGGSLETIACRIAPSGSSTSQAAPAQRNRGQIETANFDEA